MADRYFRPVSGFDLPRFAGVAIFMRLPHVALNDPKLKDVEIGLIGVPWDSGTTNRPGPRHGPRQLRDMSTMMRAQNGATGVRPFEIANCADLGDVAPNTADLMDTMSRVTAFYEEVKASGVRPLTAGGDHLTSLPVLRALAKDAPVSMILFIATPTFLIAILAVQNILMERRSGARLKRASLIQKKSFRLVFVERPMTTKIGILRMLSAFELS